MENIRNIKDGGVNVSNLDLHNKYRPDNLKDVVGQDNIVKSIANVLEKDTSHTFLFSGPSGVGKTTLARIIANVIDCSENNILEIDAATYSGVDAMREVTGHLAFKAFGEKPHKMIIVDECHSLSKPAWQSILKAIEEPPPHVYWALCTTELDKVPATIKTRCLHYALASIDKDNVYNLLQEIAYDEGIFETNEKGDAIIDLISNECEGSMRRAIVSLSMCADCKTVKEAAKLIKASRGDKAVIDLCRWLASGSGKNWNKATSHLKPLEGQNAESIRLQVINYFAKAALGTTKRSKAEWCFHVMECFKGPTYNQSEKLAPVVLAVASVIFAGSE